MPRLDDLKAQAKRLRAAMPPSSPLTHAEALEAVAKQHGFRDWNTAHAACGNGPPTPRWTVGQIVTGAYLGHPVRGTIKAVRAWGSEGGARLSIELDQPVNVSEFDGFEVMRRRLTANVDRNGVTGERRSDGTPHLRLSQG